MQYTEAWGVQHPITRGGTEAWQLAKAMEICTRTPSAQIEGPHQCMGVHEANSRNASRRIIGNNPYLRGHVKLACKGKGVRHPKSRGCTEAWHCINL